jgi:molybdenum cofactor biosynthesis enzyme MoaA
LALQWNVDLQVVDLITTRAHRPAEELGYVTGKEGQRIVASRGAVLEREVRDRTGAVLKLYRTPTGKAWEIKDFHFGLLHSAMCDGCTRRHECGEGIYALRVDALGVVKPCLLREDLQQNLPLYEEIDGIEQTLGDTLNLMLSGKLAWN